MPWIRPLLLTALLAPVALPGHATEGPAACIDRATGADSDEGHGACVIAPSPEAWPAPAPWAPPQALDCTPFALGGLTSGASASGIHASQLVNATIRHCSIRGYIRGVALFVPAPSPARADG